MARELILIPNPTNVPEAVSTGYQRQNTNLYVLQTGLDTTEPYYGSDTANIITISAGGIIEINGSLFKLNVSVSLQKPTSYNLAYLWIAAKDNGDGSANLSLVTRPGVWNPSKKGCYMTDGSRTLNFVTGGISPNGSPTLIFNKTTKGMTTYLIQKGWYFFMVVSGLGGGVGGSGKQGAGAASAGGGGVAASYNVRYKMLFIEKEQVLTIRVGGNGFNGGDGGNGAGNERYAGGGGGGSGEGSASSIDELGIIADAYQGGNGGKGGDAIENYGGGGGGGLQGGSPGRSGGGGALPGVSVTGGVIFDTYGGQGGTGAGGIPGGITGRSSNGAKGGNATTNFECGGGGGMGSHGMWRPEGSSSAGYVRIYKMEN
jgi:hypothetical protein